MRRAVHIIDSDCTRRARVARELSGRNLHAEIYEDLDEFARHCPTKGAIFAADDGTVDGFADLADVIQSTGAALPFVIYANATGPERIVRAMLEGALDYLAWSFDPHLLDLALERLVSEGERRAWQQGLRLAAKAKIGKLSPRETDVLVHLMQGLPNKAIAQAIEISPRTVEIHRGNLMKKLNAKSASDAVRIALYAGVDGDFRPSH